MNQSTNKVFVGKKVSSPLFIFLILGTFFLLGACSKSDDQKEFEQDALAQPKNITVTDANGKVTNEDPDDWRISPMYAGLISISSGSAEPPFPNPVNYNSNLTIQVYLNVADAVDAIILRSFRFSTAARSRQIKYVSPSELNSFNNITIPARIIADNKGSNASDVYRILIYDGKQNLISYGDVEVK